MKGSTYTFEIKLSALPKNEDLFSITMNIMGPDFTGSLFLGD